MIVDPCCKGKTEINVAEELKDIQTSRSINDIINFKQISPDRIKLIGKSASAFYSEYFANGAKLLQNELEEVERGDKLFQ